MGIAKTKRNIKNKKEEEKIEINLDKLYDISTSINKQTTINNDLRELFADVDLAEDILVTSIVSPNSLNDDSLLIEFDGFNISSTVKNNLTNTLETYIKNNYDLKPKIKNIVRKSLVREGSYPILVLPKNFIDTLYIKKNVSVEDYYNPETKIEKDEFFILEDNIEVLLENKDIDLESKKHIFEEKDIYEHKEDLNKLLELAFSEDLKLIDDSVLEINENVESLSRPLVKEVKNSNIIPIYFDSPENHIGYFMLVDDNNITIENHSHYDSFNIQELIKEMKKNKTELSVDVPKIENIEEKYSKMLEGYLKSKLKNKNIDVDAFKEIENQILYIVMKRALKNKKTKVVFIPKEYLIYIAFDYRENGTGKSILEKSRVLLTLRSLLFMSTVGSKILNAIPETIVSTELSEKDLRPEKTMEKVRAIAYNSRSSKLPLHLTKIDNVADWLHKAGFVFKWSGGEIPQMNIDVTESEKREVPDNSDTLEELKSQIAMSFLLTPELLDKAKEAEFATTIVIKDALFRNRISDKQETLNRFLTQYLKMIMKTDKFLELSIKKQLEQDYSKILNYIKTNSEKIYNKINKNDKKKIINWVYFDMISKVKYNLIKPIVDETDGLDESFNNFLDNLDKTLEGLFSETTSEFEEHGELLEDYSKALKNKAIREWLYNNGYMNEILESFENNEAGERKVNVLTDYKEFMLSIIKAKEEEEKSTTKKEENIIESDEKGDNGSTNNGDATDNTNDNKVDNAGSDNSDDNKDDNKETDENNKSNKEDDENGLNF